MNQYMLLLHETPASYASLGPTEMQALIQRYRDWSARLAQQGLLVGGEKLADDGGRHLRLKGDRPLASDGPYAEAHDVVGGYFTVQAADDAAAEAVAATCPHLHGSNWIEIRRIEPMPGPAQDH
jgi:hypothetical protein